MTPRPTDTDIDRLQALRGRLEARLADPATTARDLAAVSREYRQLLVQLSAIAPSAKASPADEIAARRSKRTAS